MGDRLNIALVKQDSPLTPMEGAIRKGDVFVVKEGREYTILQKANTEELLTIATPHFERLVGAGGLLYGDVRWTGIVKCAPAPED